MKTYYERKLVELIYPDGKIEQTYLLSSWDTELGPAVTVSGPVTHLLADGYSVQEISKGAPYETVNE